MWWRARDEEGGVKWKWAETPVFERCRVWAVAGGIGVCVVLAVLVCLDDPPRRISRSGWGMLGILELMVMVWIQGVATHRQVGNWRMASAIRGFAVGSAAWALGVMVWWAVWSPGVSDAVAGWRMVLVGGLVGHAVALLQLARATAARECGDDALACPKCGYDLRGTPVLEGKRGRAVKQCSACGWVALPGE